MALGKFEQAQQIVDVTFQSPDEFIKGSSSISSDPNWDRGLGSSRWHSNCQNVHYCTLNLRKKSDKSS